MLLSLALARMMGPDCPKKTIQYENVIEIYGILLEKTFSIEEFVKMYPCVDDSRPDAGLLVAVVSFGGLKWSKSLVAPCLTPFSSMHFWRANFIEFGPIDKIVKN